MILKRLDSFKFSWVLAFLIIFITPIVKTQIPGCSLDGIIELEQCLNQVDRSNFTDICCKALSRVVQGGYNCLCLLVSSSAVPILSTPISFPLSNCFIVVPPLSQCRVFAPMPVVLPPDIPKQPPSPPTDVIVPPSPPEMQIPSNSTADSNSTVDRHPDLVEISVPRLCALKSENQTSNAPEKKERLLLHLSLFLSLAFHACVFLSAQSSLIK